MPADVRQAITQWANGCLTQSVAAGQPDNMRLVSYRLDEISIGGNSDDPIYYADYSVLPFVANSDWRAGSGVQVENGWIAHKVKPFRAVHEGGVLKLTSGLP